ncbi:TPA: hypothetical protein N0F65_001628 [Lagenidium giganteum]|uniref:Uncharacterized protein n=1 Tax=Lagenidium giganteum TaxID=4803 RepID=A0AAV2YL13_9STRA|nr:TPA: hypothetical protein N0F65_001628 [Lagenidium giganteum]
MDSIINAIDEAGESIPASMTEHQAAELYRTGMRRLPLAPSTRKRRLEELAGVYHSTTCSRGEANQSSSLIGQNVA